ncbi:MAG TPA: cyclase family protein [Bryobacteraceae bacterium]|nr:cyclase family protein [Bryobacteraceae bacterium]
MASLLNALSAAAVHDLSQPYFVGMPHFPTHPPFLHSLTREHGDQVGPEGHSSCADALAMGSHRGTHIDALCHFSRHGRIFGGEPVKQSYAEGIAQHAADTIAPILRRAVLLDIAGLEHVPALARDFEITPEHLETASAGIAIGPGDIVLLRTGWAAYFAEPARFLQQGHSPGPSLAGARWLSERRVFAAGSDTLPFEKVPSETMPVHVHLLVESGIHIMECLNLEQLAAAAVREFVFVAAPLKLQGATGAPMRPLGLVPR